MFRDDEETTCVILIGEIGGAGEELAAAYLRDNGYNKPVFGFIAGHTAPAGKKDGPRGAPLWRAAQGLRNPNGTPWQPPESTWQKHWKSCSISRVRQEEQQTRRQHVKVGNQHRRNGNSLDPGPDPSLQRAGSHVQTRTHHFPVRHRLLDSAAHSRVPFRHRGGRGAHHRCQSPRQPRSQRFQLRRLVDGPCSP